MEAKQSREEGCPKAMSLPGQLDLLEADYQPRGQRSANRAWDQLMIAGVAAGGGLRARHIAGPRLAALCAHLRCRALH